MKQLLVFIIMGLLMQSLVFAKVHRYGERYCNESRYYCVKVQRGDSWERLWPDSHERDVVRRLNRMNVPLQRGMIIAVPNDIHYTSTWDISPFPHQKQGTGRKTVIFNQKHLAWGAYNEYGDLVRWGPAAGGQRYCADVNRRCRTVVGSFSMYHKKDHTCYSKKYPLGKGGAPMPHCMFFYRGYAFHGSPVVPGYHASHGCIRLFNEDAQWLNLEFIDLPGSGRTSTKVIVEPL